MTKKLTIFFAVLTAICVVAAVPLIPFAIRDTSNMLVSTVDALDDMEVKEQFHIPDNVEKLDIRTGNLYMPYIYIVHSNSKDVTVRSDSLGYMHIKPMIITAENSITIDLNFQNTPDYPFPDSAQEIQNALARAIAENEYCTIEIAVPDGLVLTMDGRDLNLNDVFVDGDVRYLTTEDIVGTTTPEAPLPELELTTSFETRVQDLRNNMMSLVRDNAQGSFDQLDFNMHLNDCRIEMEALLMEYAKENDLINYDKYKDQPQSSVATGISGISSGAILTPFDTSVSESEARTLIHDLTGLYLSRLTVQAKLDYTVYELVGNEEDPELLEAKMDYEAAIQTYTDSITSLEELHTDFIMGLMETGLLF